MTLTIELPDIEPLNRLKTTTLREGLIALLYSTGLLSSFEACQILQLDRREFEELLPRFGLSILADTPENIAIELQA